MSAARHGFEPQSPDPKSGVLPLDERAKMTPYDLVWVLAKLRMDADLTQEDVAVRIGCSSRHVLQFENGRVDPRMSFLVDYARAVGANLSIRVRPKATFEVALSVVLPEGLEPTLSSS